MNRIILFRGKRIDNEEWIEGFYSMYVEIGDNGGVECYYRETRDEIHYISDLDGISNYVYPETVGQSTGFVDKNGTKIFEGDILAVKFNHRYMQRYSWEGPPDAIATVIYDFSGFRLKAKGETDSRYADFWDFIDNIEQNYNILDMNRSHSEIVGNIHDKEDK